MVRGEKSFPLSLAGWGLLENTDATYQRRSTLESQFDLEICVMSPGLYICSPRIFVANRLTG
jgi:hypothetical protein